MPLTAEKRNVFLLVGTQALFQTSLVLLLTASGLVGQNLATNKTLATLPIAMMILATALTLIPASLFMQRKGRKAGFLVGTAIGALAGLLAALGIWRSSFELFVIGNMLIGVYQAFAQYYRFAAADAASPDFKSRAISWVVAGGVVAAIAGPNIARYTQDVGPAPFVVAFLILFLLSTIAFFLVTRLELPPPTAAETSGPSRPLAEIMAQPVFLTALTGSVVGFAMMLMVMSATPLAMQLCGHSVGAAASVIQWHVLGMFVPSFFTGNLIRRFGVLNIMGAGIILMAAQILFSLSGIDLFHFTSGLVLLGIGWNFLFVGGTTLLTEAYRPSEKAKTQAAHDFLMFVAVTLSSFASGSLLNSYGWKTVNLTVVPFLLLALVVVISFGFHRTRTADVKA
jgi:predicted MFS family arabinose efflux permease